MYILFQLCDIHWLLWSLVPFLLGYLVGYLVWKKYRDLWRGVNDDLAACRKNSKQWEVDLSECRKAYHILENENASLRGRIRELELQLEARMDRPLASAISAASPVVSTVAAVASPSATAGDEGAIKRGTVNMYAALKSDNLQVIEGIGPKMEEVLHAAGIHTWSELSHTSPEKLRKILDEAGRGKYQIIDPTTWPSQAQLASSGQWEELIRVQKVLDTGRESGSGETDAKVEKILIKMGLLRKFAKDDLKIVEGIGPKIEILLHDADIKTWEALANTSVDRLQGILNQAGDRFRLADPHTWPAQSRMAANNQWAELEAYQQSLTGGRE